VNRMAKCPSRDKFKKTLASATRLLRSRKANRPSTQINFLTQGN